MRSLFFLAAAYGRRRGVVGPLASRTSQMGALSADNLSSGEPGEGQGDGAHDEAAPVSGDVERCGGVPILILIGFVRSKVLAPTTTH